MSPSRILLLLTLMLVGLVTLFQQIGVLFGTSCLFSLVLVVVFLTSEEVPCCSRKRQRTASGPSSLPTKFSSLLRRGLALEDRP